MFYISNSSDWENCLTDAANSKLKYKVILAFKQNIKFFGHVQRLMFVRVNLRSCSDQNLVILIRSSELVFGNLIPIAVKKQPLGQSSKQDVIGKYILPQI